MPGANAVSSKSPPVDFDPALAEREFAAADYGGVLVALMNFRVRHPDRAAPFMMAGKALLRLRRNSEAEVVFADAMARFATEPRVHAEWTDCAVRRADWAEANRRAEQMRRSFPDQVFGYVRGGRILHDMGRSDDADRLFMEAAQRFPQDSWPMTERAECALLSRDWSNALRLCEEICSRFPSLPFGYVSSGRALRELGRFDEADAVFTNAARRFPKDPWPVNEWARLALARKDWEAAALRCGEVQRRFPDLPFGYANQGRALREIGRFSEAEASLEKAMTRFPQEPSLAIEWTNCAFDRRDWLEAARRCDLVRERFPDISFGYVSHGRAVRELGRLDEADRLFSQATQRFGDDPWPMIEWAGMPFRRREWSEGLQRCEQLRKRFPNASFGYLGSGRALREIGKFNEAERFFATAISRFPRDPQVVRDWVEWLTVRYHWDKLLDYTGNALQSVGRDDPEYLTLRLGQAEAHRERDETAEAVQILMDLLPAFASDSRVVRQSVETCVRAREFALARSLWARLLESESVDKQALAIAVRRIYPSFYEIPGSEIFVEWIFRAAGKQDWMGHGIETISFLVMRHDSFKELRAALAAFYRSLDRYSLDPLVRATAGSYFGDVLSCAAYTELFVDHFPFWASTSEQKYGIFFAFPFIEHNAIGYDRERAENIINGLDAAVDQLIEQNLALPQDARLVIDLLLIADTLPCKAEARIERFARQHLASLAEHQPDTPAGALRYIVENRRNAKVARQPVALMRRRPRVCLEISGQLRGYQAAFKSWKNFGLSQTDTTIVVHTWNTIGGKLPSDPTFAYRTFQGDFLRAYVEVLTELGWPFIESRYPSLIRGLQMSELATAEQLQAFYKPAAVIVQDEQEPNVVGRSNQWKMHYKIYETHQLALKHAPDCDLYVRIRPDFNFEVDIALNWMEVYDAVKDGDVMLAQFGRKIAALTGGITMGDQIAIGTKSAMTAYADVFPQTVVAQDGKLFGYPREYAGHASLAYQTFYSGIKVKNISRLTSGNPLLNPAHVHPKKVQEWLLADVGAAPRDSVDQRFLSAVSKDLSVDAQAASTAA